MVLFVIKKRRKKGRPNKPPITNDKIKRKNQEKKYEVYLTILHILPYSTLFIKFFPFLWITLITLVFGSICHVATEREKA